MSLKTTELKGLFSRVYENQMNATDEADIKALVKKVFGNGDVTPDPSLLHQFNNLVVQKADEIAKPMVTNMISVLANVKHANRDQVVKYEIPQKLKSKVRWSANGSGVDLVRVEGQKFETAVPRTFSTGFYYEPFGMIQDAVAGFKFLIEDIANAKVALYFAEISKLVEKAITSGKIPAKNVLSGDNLTLKAYNELASRIQRVAGGRPVTVADSLLIRHFADQQAAAPQSALLTDKVRESLVRDLSIEQVGITDAVNLVNPFVDEDNDKTELPINVGYMLAGSGTQKPFVLTEFGSLRQLTQQSVEDERVVLKLVQDADIQLLFGQAIAQIKENTAVAL